MIIEPKISFITLECTSKYNNIVIELRKDTGRNELWVTEYWASGKIDYEIRLCRLRQNKKYCIPLHEGVFGNEVCFKHNELIEALDLLDEKLSIKENKNEFVFINS